MNWQGVAGGLVFGAIALAFYVTYLTHRHKTHNASSRRRRKQFQPDWERRRGDTGRKRGIRIGR